VNYPIQHLLLWFFLIGAPSQTQALSDSVSNSVEKICVHKFLWTVPNNLSGADNRELLDFITVKFGSCKEDMVSLSTTAIDIPWIKDDIILRAWKFYYLIYRKDGVFISILLAWATTNATAKRIAQEKITGK
jgi:hypothetical protein